MGWFERPEFGANVGLIDEIYRQYLDNPESVSPAWRDFFAENEPDGDGEPAVEAAVAAPPTQKEAPTAKEPAPKEQPKPKAREEPRPEPDRRQDGKAEAKLVPLRGA